MIPFILNGRIWSTRRINCETCKAKSLVMGLEEHENRIYGAVSTDQLVGVRGGRVIDTRIMMLSLYHYLWKPAIHVFMT